MCFWHLSHFWDSQHDIGDLGAAPNPRRFWCASKYRGQRQPHRSDLNRNSSQGSDCAQWTMWSISSNVGIATISPPPFITIFLGGINHQKWVVYGIAMPTLCDFSGHLWHRNRQKWISITEASVAVRGQRAVQIVSNPGNGSSGGPCHVLPKTLTLKIYQHRGQWLV